MRVLLGVPAEHIFKFASDALERQGLTDAQDLHIYSFNFCLLSFSYFYFIFLR
jgi:hypothetical protein